MKTRPISLTLLLAALFLTTGCGKALTSGDLSVSVGKDG